MRMSSVAWSAFTTRASVLCVPASASDCRLWTDRRAAYAYLPTNDEHWHTALATQRALARPGRHRAVGMADLLTATLAAAHQLTIVHYDADFDAAAMVLRFQHRWVLRRGSVWTENSGRTLDRLCRKESPRLR